LNLRKEERKRKERMNGEERKKKKIYIRGKGSKLKVR
jgi:hypothetical protein